jgi:SAM-dependent methyltransferase
MAAVSEKDFIVDLGSGDGRIVITAAKEFGARGFGVDISEQLVDVATAAAHRERVADRVRFIRQDAFKTDIREASVLTLYLLPEILLDLRPKILTELKPGSRVVSHDYNFGEWESDHAVVFDTPEKEVINGTNKTSLFLYVVPAHVAGTWQIRLPGPEPGPTVEVSLQQSYQRISGNTVGTDAQDLKVASLRGDRIDLSVPFGKSVLMLRGRVVGDRIEGIIDGRGKTKPGFSAIRVANGKALGWE